MLFLIFSCGSEYTLKLETIIAQYNKSLENQKAVQEIALKNGVTIGLNVKIFGEGTWPTQGILELNINFFPQEIGGAFQSFKQFWTQKENKMAFKISMLESKIRWIYYFDLEKDEENANESCYFDTNCLQGALLYNIYRSRPNKTGFSFLQQKFAPINDKTIQDNINKLVNIFLVQIETQDNILTRTIQNNQTYYQFNKSMRTKKRLISYEQASIHEE